jgi:hypothetical protein
MQRLRHSHALLFMLFCLMTAATLRLTDLPQVPPGVHYDEAANGVLVSEIAFEGNRPFSSPATQARKSSFFTWLAD